MVKVYRNTLVAVLVLTGFFSYQAKGQQLSTPQKRQLQQFSDSLRESAHNARERAYNWAEVNNVAVRVKRNDGGVQELQYLDEKGLPVFYQTLNSGAAITTRTNALYQNGALGLSLSGKGMKVGVWDGGAVKKHSELVNRFIQTDGAGELSDHATHVTGTIIATGLNASAKGMAFEADAITNDWNSDIAEMASHASNGLLLSNHSYGMVLGWSYDDGAWKWYGGDGQEDYRFGLYSSESQALDKLAREAPYYTIVWAAGNDRSDTGDGSKPADGPFDTIGPAGVAKNIITVGAVEKVTEYVDHSSVRMSSFSSWGPTDDGRIKPDIVGAGVGIFSTMASGDNQYASLNGTSMASPNVTGSLLLLQQLNQQVNGSFLKSSTLKGLAIHTAREAGAHSGPDYQYGWGLLDTQTAASAILNNVNGRNYIIQELNLKEGGVVEIPVTSDGNKPVRVTISWTDAPASISGASIDPKDIKLVNDLDVRVSTTAGSDFAPWILDPANPFAAAKRGDNIRDNVEQVVISNPEAREYIIKVSHKGSLANAEQAFSVIIEYSGQESDNNTLYWIGGSGQWHDASHWSLTSGGTPANLVPSAEDNAVFDENSFSGETSQVSVTQPVAAANFRWYSNAPTELLLNGQTISVNGSVILNSSNLTVAGGGTFMFSGKQPLSQLNLKGVKTPEVDFIFDNPEGDWSVNALTSANTIEVVDGKLKAEGLNATVKRLITGENTDIASFKGTVFAGLKELKFLGEPSVIDLSGSVIKFSGSPGEALTLSASKGMAFPALELAAASNLIISDSVIVDQLNSAGEVSFLNSATVNNLILDPGAGINLEEDKILNVGKTISLIGTAEQPINITGSGANGSRIRHDIYSKICGDFLVVKGVSADGKATFNAGANSSLENAQNWQKEACEDVLFADFTVSYPCTGALTSFDNFSTGNVTDFQWLIDGVLQEQMDDFSSTFSFNESGAYNVKLIINNGEFSSVNEKTIVVGENTLKKPEIVINDNLLAATTPADLYQWYRDGQALEGANKRTYDTGGKKGVYQVAVMDSLCNAASAPIVVTAIEEEEVMATASVEGIKIYANPIGDVLHIETQSSLGKWKGEIYDLQGRLVVSGFKGLQKSEVEVSHLKEGIYILRLYIDKEIKSFKLYKN